MHRLNIAFKLLCFFASEIVVFTWSDKKWARSEVRNELDESDQNIEILNSPQSANNKITIILVTMLIYLVLILFLSVLGYFVWKTAMTFLRHKEIEIYKQELSEITGGSFIKNIERYPVINLDASTIETLED